MILDRLDQSSQYCAINARFVAAFNFLRRPDLADLAPGRYEIDGERVFALVQRPQGRPVDDAKLEAHRAYIDVQYVVDGGADTMGWRSTPTCEEVAMAYDEKGDAALYADAPSAFVKVEPGAFAVFFPEDAHMPNIAEGALHKVVVKVRCR